MLPLVTARMQKRIDDLYQDSVEMKEEISRLSKRIGDLHPLSKRVSKVEGRLSKISITSVEIMVRETVVDVTEMHRLYKLLLLKTNVTTELRFYLAGRQRDQALALSGAAKAYDYPDSFWAAIEERPLIDLALVFIKLGLDDLKEGAYVPE